MVRLGRISSLYRKLDKNEVGRVLALISGKGRTLVAVQVVEDIEFGMTAGSLHELEFGARSPPKLLCFK